MPITFADLEAGKIDLDGPLGRLLYKRELRNYEIEEKAFIRKSTSCDYPAIPHRTYTKWNKPVESTWRAVAS
jgi:hypothetical protein